MRILHVWCQAGVACLMAKAQRELGHTAHVVKRKGFDGLGQDDFYNIHYDGPGELSISELVLDTSFKRKLYLRLPRRLRAPIRALAKATRTLKFFFVVRQHARRYDILHIHSEYKVAFFTLFCKKVFEFHGDDMRACPRKSRSKLFGKIDRVIDRLFLHVFKRVTHFYVSTPDMLAEVPDSCWLPNPVDTKHFRSCNPKKLNGNALYTHNWYETGDHARTWAKQHNVKLAVIDRVKQRYVHYKDMPSVLANFEYFIDRHAIHSLSKTALEALALGLKVVRWDGKIVEGLPECHRPENVARLTLKVYEQTLN